MIIKVNLLLDENRKKCLNTRLFTTANIVYAPYCLSLPLQIKIPAVELIQDVQKIAPDVQRIHKPFRHIGFAELRFAPVQRSLNFCLPAASQLPHPKGMCLNAALNKIAFKTHST